ncbi:hypothetical protein [Dyella subtropica]|uniref:hypothetical protein n=1 Tax=Dyella subtropica TaxID=2992127 RepID=UPI0022514C90|nr:hypothetical protein [Dyella subtropica]
MDERDIRDSFLHVAQGKTKTKRRIQVSGQPADLLARIAACKASYKVQATRQVIGGDGGNR